MNITLWVLQAVLAFMFAMAGAMKLMRTKEQLASTMGWVGAFSPGAIKAIGTAEILAALGLIVPGLIGLPLVLSALAATGLVLLMVGAIVTHARRHETMMIMINVILGVLAAVVAWGRFGL